MQAQATDSSPVVDQCGELLGILSKNKMNRNVGGFGHDPKTEPVEAHIEKNNAYCFEDQTIAEAEQMMLNAKLGEVFGSNPRKAGRTQSATAATVKPCERNRTG